MEFQAFLPVVCQIESLNVNTGLAHSTAHRSAVVQCLFVPILAALAYYVRAFIASIKAADNTPALDSYLLAAGVGLFDSLNHRIMVIMGPSPLRLTETEQTGRLRHGRWVIEPSQRTDCHP